MEFLRTTYPLVGYPLIFFYLIGFIGIVLALFRPFWAFLFALFCLAARNFHAAVFTRTPFAGPYLNLNDLLLWIALIAMFFELMRTRKMLWMPKILFVIFILIIIGDLQSLFKFGTEEHVLRRIWSTAIFPILFLVSANMVKNEERAKLFYWTLFLGAIVAAIQHMYFIWSASYYEMSEESQIRTISYILSGGLFLIISSIFVKPDKSLKRFKLISFYIGIALIALSYVLSLTRGIYVIGILSLIVFPFLLKDKYAISRGAYKFAIVSLLALFFVEMLFPNLDLKAIVNKRFESFIYKDTFEKSYESRKLGQQTELELWMNGTLIFGEGSSLPPEYEYSESKDPTGALYHVAFSTYLAHYGFIGLFMYGFLLPFSTIMAARRYYFKYMTDYGGKIALIAIACALFDVFAFAYSHHHLGSAAHISGLIYGAMWGLYHFIKAEEKASAFHTYRHPTFAPSSTFGKYGK